MIIANEARKIVLLTTPPKSRKLKVNAGCCVKSGYRVKWYAGRLLTRRFVATTCMLQEFESHFKTCDIVA